MYCSECGKKFEGNFCPFCGAPSEMKTINKETTNVYAQRGQNNRSVEYNKNANFLQYTQVHPAGYYPEPVKKKKGLGYYIKMAVIWYMTVAFLMAGVSVGVSGVNYIAAIVWFIGGVVLCPLCFKNYSYKKKACITVILFLVGVFFMP